MRERTNGLESFRWAAAATVLVGMAASLCLAAPPQRGRPTRGRRTRGVSLKPGDAAPDFELPILTLVKGKDGQKVGKISKNKIKLSSFRNKRVVCIFSSSYT